MTSTRCNNCDGLLAEGKHGWVHAETLVFACPRPWGTPPSKPVTYADPAEDPEPEAKLGARCRRCGHKLSAPSSIDRKYSLRCWRLERSEARERARAEAVAIAAAPFGKLAIGASELIEARKLTVIRPGVWRAESSTSEGKSYVCTSLSCQCRAAGFGNLCRHRCAAAMATAYLEFDETYRKVA